MMASTLTAMVLNLTEFLRADSVDLLLTSVGGVLLLLGVWLLVESVLVVLRPREAS